MTLILTVVSRERYALQKTCQTILLWDTVDRRKKTPSIKGVSTSLHVLSQELKNSYHSFLSPVSKRFYSLLPVYLLSSDRIV